MNAKAMLARIENEDGTAIAADDLSRDVIVVGCFAVTRNSKDRVATLTLKSTTGNECSLDWTWAPDVIYVPGNAAPLTLVLPSRGFKLEIIGINLRPLAECLQQRRVVWIKAQDAMHAAMENGDTTVVVEGFRIAPVGESEDWHLLQGALGSG